MVEITSLKTLNKLTSLSLVSFSLNKVTSLYERVKHTNSLTKSTFSVAEASFNTFNKIVTLPLTNVFQKQSNAFFILALNYLILIICLRLSHSG
jgi:hypothetical protein